MKIIVTIVETITREAHIYIPDGQSQEAIKQEILDRYNTSQLANSFNITQVNFVSISAQIVTPNQSAELVTNL